MLPFLISIKQEVVPLQYFTQSPIFTSGVGPSGGEILVLFSVSMRGADVNLQSDIWLTLQVPPTLHINYQLLPVCEDKTMGFSV